jgi:MFS family permease
MDGSVRVARRARRTDRSGGAPTLHLAVVGGGVLLTSIAAFFRVPILPSLGQELAMGPAELGLITTVFAIGRIVTDLPAGRLTDRVRTLTLLSVSSLILAGGSLLMAGARSPAAVLVAAFVLGVASSIANTTGMTYFSTARSATQRGRTLALYSASLLVGQAFGPTIGGALAGPFGWRGALVGASMVAGVILVGTRLAARYVRPPIGSNSERTRAVADAATDEASTTVATVVEAPADEATVAEVPADGRHAPGAVEREIRILMLVPFTIFFVLGSLPQTLIPIIGDERYGLSAAAIGLALGVGGVSRLIGVLIGGRVADLIGRKVALVPGMLVTVLGVAMLALDVGIGGWVLAIVMVSLGTSGIGVAATMLTDLAGGRNVGRRLGMYRLYGDLGLIVGPAVSTTIYVRAGQAASALTVAGLVSVAAVLTTSLVRETRGRDLQH